MADRNLELALRIRADMKQAQQALNELERELRDTGDAAKAAGTGARAASEGVDAVGRAAKQAESSARALNTRMESTRTIGERVNSTFHDLRNILVGAFVAHELISFTSELVHANVEAQRIHYTLQQVFGEKGAQQQFAFVSQEAQRLGLDLKTAAEGYANLAASAQGTGLQTATLQKLFNGLSESATVLHSSAQQVNGVMIQLAQGMSLGRLQMQDIRAIAQNLPGTMTLVSEAARRMGLNFEEAMQGGGLPAIKFLSTFADVLHERFGVQAVEASHSLNAELNRLKTTLFDVTTQGNDFADSFAGAIRELDTSLNDPQVREGLRSLITLLADVASEAVKAGAKIGDFLGGVKGFAEYAAAMQQGAGGFDAAGLSVERGDIEAELRQRAKHPVLSGLNSFLAGTENNVVQNALEGGRPRIQAMSTTALQSRLREIDAQLKQIQANKPAPRNPQEGDNRGLLFPLGPTGDTTTVDPEKAKKIAEQAAKAQNDLTQSLIQLQAALDPTAAAYAKFNAAVKKANDDAALAKKAHGANTEAIDAQKDAIIGLAQAELDEAKAKIAAKKMADEDKPVADLLKKAPGGYKVPVQIGGPLGELMDVQKQLTDLKTWHTEAEQANQIFRMQDLANEKQYQQNKENIEQRYRQRKAEYDQAAQQLSLAAAEQGFGSLASAMSNLYGQQSKQYRAAFALQKAAAIASTLVEGPKAIGKAFGESGNPLVGFVFAATLIAEFASLMAAIRGVSFSSGGYTGPGGKYQPAGIVHAGEVVWSQADIARAGGVQTVEALRQGVRGYADGGFVHPLSDVPSPSQMGFQAPSTPAVNAGKLTVAVTPVTVIVHSSGGGDDVQSKQSTDNNGGQVLELFLGKVAKDINDGGVVAKAADRRWLLKRKGNSYG